MNINVSLDSSQKWEINQGKVDYIVLKNKSDLSSLFMRINKAYKSDEYVGNFAKRLMSVSFKKADKSLKEYIDKLKPELKPELKDGDLSELQRLAEELYRAAVDDGLKIADPAQLIEIVRAEMELLINENQWGKALDIYHKYLPQIMGYNPAAFGTLSPDSYKALLVNLSDKFSEFLDNVGDFNRSNLELACEMCNEILTIRYDQLRVTKDRIAGLRETFGSYAAQAIKIEAIENVYNALKKWMSFISMCLKSEKPEMIATGISAFKDFQEHLAKDTEELPWDVNDLYQLITILYEAGKGELRPKIKIDLYHILKKVKRTYQSEFLPTLNEKFKERNGPLIHWLAKYLFKYTLSLSNYRRETMAILISLMFFMLTPQEAREIARRYKDSGGQSLENIVTAVALKEKEEAEKAEEAKKAKKAKKENR